MSSQTKALGPAVTSWNDFVGTAAADNLDVTQADNSLYRIAGLHPARWLIAAVDYVLRDDDQCVTVYAFDREHTGITTHADLLEFADTHGELPVSAIELRDPQAARSWLGRLFRGVTLRLVARGLKDVPLVVSDRSSR